MNAQEILKRNLQLSEFGHPIWSESSVIAAMEEYAQQSQSNPSKLVAALEKIANECTSNDISISFIEHEAQQALESYKDGWVSVKELSSFFHWAEIKGWYTLGNGSWWNKDNQCGLPKKTDELLKIYKIK